MDQLLEQLRANDVAERQRAADAIVQAWQQWSTTDIDKLAKAAASADAELAGQTTYAIARVRVRRALGKDILDTLKQPDLNLFSRDPVSQLLDVGLRT